MCWNFILIKLLWLFVWVKQLFQYVIIQSCKLKNYLSYTLCSVYVSPFATGFVTVMVRCSKVTVYLKDTHREKVP